MKYVRGLGVVLAAVAVALCMPRGASAKDSPKEVLERIRVPEGFKVSIFATGLPNGRSMRLGENGTLFVGTKEAGAVYAVVDEDGDYVADKTYTLIEKGQKLPDGSDIVEPNGVALLDGDLYVAATGTVFRLDDIEANLANPPEPVIVTDALPDDRWHGWKFIGFGPDGKLYVPVGAPCNVCEREDIYATINRMNPDGSGLQTVARGVRNTVGFDWHPETGQLWFTDNGRDTMGDDMPADELNKVSEPGQHFGFPYVHQGDTLDPYFGEGRDPEHYAKPEIKLGPHVAALGMRFYTGEMFPAEYKNQIFIAEHGSWNRRDKIGYRVTLVRLENGKAVSYEPFAEGWLDGKRAYGRPADVLVMPDGSLLVSDEMNGTIFRITYEGEG